MLQEIDSPAALASLIASHPHVCIVFSATWCGPCTRSKPQVQALAERYTADPSMNLQMGIVYEHVLGPDNIRRYNISAFPTYVLFQNGSETARVQGANLPGLEQMIANGNCKAAMPTTGGSALGGATTGDARAARLAKLGGASHEATTSTSTSPPTAAAPMETTAIDPGDTAAQPMETDDDPSTTDPTAKLNPDFVTTLTESMGFSVLRAQKGLLYGNGGTVEGAIDWLMQHQDDDDIDEPIPPGPVQTAQSYKCNDCGKILSNLANLELHANKTGHSDFEESTEAIVPLTEEEKKAKIAEVKELLRLKRAEREEAEKVDDVTREMQRRNMGKEMAKTREQMEAEARKREAQQRKREKDAFKKERARLRAELAKDKAERQANQGKLQSRLGVDGYQPDGIQYDVPTADEMAAAPTHQESPQPKKFKADESKIAEYIQKVSSYRAGGDGGKCLKILKAYVGNVVDHPDDGKFKSINMDNKAFKTKVKPFIGAKQLLMAVGFLPNDSGTMLELTPDRVNPTLLAATKAKLEAAMATYG